MMCIVQKKKANYSHTHTHTHTLVSNSYIHNTLIGVWHIAIQNCTNVVAQRMCILCAWECYVNMLVTVTIPGHAQVSKRSSVCSQNQHAQSDLTRWCGWLTTLSRWACDFCRWHPWNAGELVVIAINTAFMLNARQYGTSNDITYRSNRLDTHGHIIL